MANSIFVVFVVVFVLQIGTGKDIRWIRNSNWNNVDNWSLGRLPCKGDIASFSQVTPLSGQKPVIYFNTNSTVRRLLLPRNGRIVLKPSITVQLTANESCEISRNTVPMAAAGSSTGGGEVNNFIGVRANKWECPENWATDDNSSITHAPCGSDIPVFPSGSAFSYITSAMGNIFVNSVLLGAEKPPNFDSHSDELLLNLSVNPECQNNPELCPCISVDNDCNVMASTTSLSTMTPTASSASLTVSSTATSSFATAMQSSTSMIQSSTSMMQSSASLSPSSMTSSLSFTSSPSPVISIPGNVGVTSSTRVPIPDISGPIGPIATAGITNNDDSGSSSAAMIGAIVGVIVVLLILVIIIGVIVIIFVRKRKYKETKHSHLEEDDHGFATKETGTAAYDNPVYECNLSIHSTDQLENPLF